MDKLQPLFNLIVSIEYITLLVAIFLLHNKRTGRWQLFIPMLFVIVVAETLGWYFRYFLHRSNAWIFNINMIITISFMLWMLATAAIPYSIRKVIHLFLVIFIVFAVTNLFLFEGITHYDQYTEVLGDVIQVIVCCIILYQLIKSDAYNNLLSYEYFWLANGILFSAMGGAFLYIFPVAFSNFQKHTGINIFGILNNVLNSLLYGSMIIAFICRNQKTKSL